MEIHGRVRNGQIVLSPTIAALRDQYLRKFKDGTPILIRLTRITQGKTYQQVKCHWGLVIGMIRQEFANRGMDLATLLGSPHIPEGIEVPPDVIQAILYATCNHVGEAGERKTMRQMDTFEQSRFFDNCRNYAATAWQIEIPDPDPLWKLKDDKDKI